MRIHITEHVIMLKIWNIVIFYYVPCVKGCNTDCTLVGVYVYNPNYGMRGYKVKYKAW